MNKKLAMKEFKETLDSVKEIPVDNIFTGIIVEVNERADMLHVVKLHNDAFSKYCKDIEDSYVDKIAEDLKSIGLERRYSHSNSIFINNCDGSLFSLSVKHDGEFEKKATESRIEIKYNNTYDSSKSKTSVFGSYEEINCKEFSDFLKARVSSSLNYKR